jgi:hypothetical protein
MFTYIYGLNAPAINLKQCKYKFRIRKIKYNIFAEQQSLRKREEVKPIKTSLDN